MNKKFTVLMCVYVACFYTLSVFGQAREPVGRISKEMVFPKKDVNFRAANDTQYWWPDSVISYYSDGTPFFKGYYDIKNRTERYAAAYDNWVLSSSNSSDGYSFGKTIIRFEESSVGLTFTVQITNWLIWTTYDKSNYTGYNTEYDKKGNLTLIDIKNTPYKGNDNYIEYRIKYNANNDPVSVERYNYDFMNQIMQFAYNEKGNPTLFQTNRIDYTTGQPIIINNDFKLTTKYNEKGNPMGIYTFAGSTSLNKWLLDEYIIFYYPDAPVVPNVEVAKNTAAGSNNKGSFDLNVNVPQDSISAGSITINFPEGFTLDDTGTSLSSVFSNFDLTVTPGDNNSWLFQLTPKTTRSAMILSEDTAKPTVHIAYTVDKNITDDTYYFTVDNILFETPGGDNIPEPAFSVPVEVNRVNTNIESVENSDVRVSGGNLFVRTDKACVITVYTVLGQPVMRQTVNPGETIIPLRQGIYLVKVGETVNKIVVR